MSALNDIGYLGTTHRTASISFLETWSRAHEDPRGEIAALAQRAGCREFLFLGTCNRLEIYYVKSNAAADAEETRRALGVRDEDTPHFEHLFGADVVAHLFNVTSGLDSMVVGEAQVLGQAKSAHRIAQESGTIGPLLDRLFQASFHAAKQVRTRTGVGSRVVSVASLGVREALTASGRDSSPCPRAIRAAILGAGSVARKVAAHLTEKRTVLLTIANRSPEHGEELAREHDASFVSLADFLADPPALDMVFVATGAPDPVLTGETAARLLERASGRVVIVDLALPRNVSLELAADARVNLLDLERLQTVARENQRLREGEFSDAGEIVKSQVELFVKRERARALSTTLERLDGHAREIARREVESLVASRFGHLSEADRDALEDWATRLAARLAQVPVTTVRTMATACESGCECQRALPEIRLG